MSSGLIENLGQSVRERYDLGDHLFATRTSEAVEGVDLVTKAEVLFWTLRHPLAVSSDAEQRYLERIRQIEQLYDSSVGTLAIAKIQSYGVDRSGIAYCVTGYTTGEPLPHVDADAKQLVRMFRDAVAVVAQFHKAGLTLGDICEESFLVKDSGAVTLIGVLGSFDIEAKRTAALPPGSTLPYIAPEQRSGAPGDYTSDIFALGMLGYRVIAGRYPFGDRIPANISSLEELLSAAPAPSLVQPDAPPWIDDLLGKCLELRSDSRFRNAEDFLTAIDESARSGYATDGGGRWARRTVMVKPRSEAVLTKGKLGAAGEFAIEGVQAEKPAPAPAAKVENGIPAKLVVIAAAGLALGVLVAGLIFLLSQGGTSKTFTTQDFAPPELQPALADLRGEDVALDQKLIALERLAKSDNAVSYSFLVQSLRGNQPIEVRKAGLERVAEKIQFQGLARTGDVFRMWRDALFEVNLDPTRMPVYLLYTKAADVTLPPDARKEALHKAFSEDRQFALQFAAALALDDADPDHFIPVLRQLLTATGTSGDLTGKGVGAMIASDRVLSLHFDKDVAKRLSEFSNADLAWTMGRLADTDSPLLFPFAEEAIRRKVVPPFQEVFLKTLLETDRYTTPRGVKVALVRGAQRLIDGNDVTTFASWLDVQAEPALLAVCAISPAPELALQAFDSLAVRSLRSEPARSLVPWIQKRFWDHRQELITSIGALGLSPVATQEQIDNAFNALMPYSGSGSLFESIVKSNDGRLIQISIDRMSSILSTPDLIKLLEHADSGVRISAIKALRDRNDITELQRILRAYDREKDEQVRQSYRDHLWVIRNREKG